ncbi:MAG: GxxExxY protein [Candidatus Korobacteraceae bacterium]
MNNSLDLKIRQIAADVFGNLGSGHSEAVYQRAMEVGLRLQHLRFEAQRVIEVRYKEHYVGEEYLDLLVKSDSTDECLIVELKAAQDVSLPEEQQLRNYLVSLKIDKGLLINCPQPSRNKKPQKARKAEPEFRSVSRESISY